MDNTSTVKETVGAMLPTIGLDGLPAKDITDKNKYVLNPDFKYNKNKKESVVKVMNSVYSDMNKALDLVITEGVFSTLGAIVDKRIVNAKYSIKDEVKFLNEYKKKLTEYKKSVKELSSAVKKGDKDVAKSQYKVCETNLSNVEVYLKNAPLLSPKAVSKSKELASTIIGTVAGIGGILTVCKAIGKANKNKLNKNIDKEYAKAETGAVNIEDIAKHINKFNNTNKKIALGTTVGSLGVAGVGAAKTVKIINKQSEGEYNYSVNREEFIKIQMSVIEKAKIELKKLKEAIEKLDNIQVAESTDIMSDEDFAYIEMVLNFDIYLENEEEKKTVSPELKRLDETRARIAEMEKEIEKLKSQLDTAEKQLEKTGEKLYENKVKGLNAKIDKLSSDKEDTEEELSKKEKQLKKEEEQIKQESAMYEAANMEDEIKPIVEILNRKGYKVKYASPGHTKLRKKEDAEPDGVYYGKLYSDARIMFEDRYAFPSAPKYWHWRDVDGCSYLDISPISHNKSDGSPDEAFRKWKTNYMNSLREFANDLPYNGKDSKKKEEPKEDNTENTEEVKESLHDFADSIFDSIFESYDIEQPEEKNQTLTENESVDTTEALLNEFDSLLS